MAQSDNDIERFPDRRQILSGAAAGTLAYLMGLRAARGQVANTPFLGEIVSVAFDFAPRGYALCNGQLLPIDQNQGLFSLLGTAFGGDGRVNFALPDLRGRTPVGASNFLPGSSGGEANHTLSAAELPQHTHAINVGTALPSGRARSSPAGSVFGASNNASNTIYGQPADLVTLAPGNLANTGGSQPHNNVQPSLCITYIIAIQGVFPSPI